MAVIKSFRDLIAWQRGMDFVVEIYRATAVFPKVEQFGLTSQLRRCAVSIPSNIAEGHGRQTTRGFLNFLSIAYGSLNEAHTQIMIAERLEYLAQENTARLYALGVEVGRLLSGLRTALAAKLKSSPNP
jgi:four helix bundle protein